MKKRTVSFLILAMWMYSPHYKANAQEAQSRFINGEEYIKKNEDIVSNSFDMCECIAKKRKQLNYRDDVLKARCQEEYKKFLMEKSMEINDIVVGVALECNEGG